MAGAICGTCHYSSTRNVEPHCGRPDCPNKNVKFLPGDAEALKRAFAEHDIPWPAMPKEKELDKHEQRDLDVRRLATMRDAIQLKLSESPDVSWDKARPAISALLTAVEVRVAENSMAVRVARVIQNGAGYNEDFCMDMARAVLGELQEPTEAMLRAAVGESPKAIWQGMLREAVK